MPHQRLRFRQFPVDLKCLDGAIPLPKYDYCIRFRDDAGVRSSSPCGLCRQGDSIGEALPWTTIGNDAGLYLRKLLHRTTNEKPIVVELEIQGKMEARKDRMSGNVYAMLSGRSGDFIVIPTHVDGYFCGLHDNASSVAQNLTLAEHNASILLKNGGTKSSFYSREITKFPAWVGHCPSSISTENLCTTLSYWC